MGDQYLEAALKKIEVLTRQAAVHESAIQRIRAFADGMRSNMTGKFIAEQIDRLLGPQ
jgi:hypothetical protein